MSSNITSGAAVLDQAVTAATKQAKKSKSNNKAATKQAVTLNVGTDTIRLFETYNEVGTKAASLPRQDQMALFAATLPLIIGFSMAPKTGGFGSRIRNILGPLVLAAAGAGKTVRSLAVDQGSVLLDAAVKVLNQPQEQLEAAVDGAVTDFLKLSAERDAKLEAEGKKVDGKTIQQRHNDVQAIQAAARNGTLNVAGTVWQAFQDLAKARVGDAKDGNIPLYRIGDKMFTANRLAGLAFGVNITAGELMKDVKAGRFGLGR